LVNAVSDGRLRQAKQAHPYGPPLGHGSNDPSC
jgi:hypothetical protein